MSDDMFGKDLGDLMSQLQQAQSQLQDIEKTMGDREVQAEAGGGVVRVTANGRLEVLSVKIEPRAMDASDPGMLEDLVLTAVNRALGQARDLMAQEMSQGLFGGKLPGMF